jgi:enoyl-CoA hydratase
MEINVLEEPIIFSELQGTDGLLGHILLNRPAVMNALDDRMFNALNQQLHQWEENPELKAVVITAAPGRAFCAGGDIRKAYELGKINPAALPVYFSAEYTMNKTIYHFSKPYIALLDGICMGGGAGVSLHGSYRVGTDKLQIAMPECGIGFFPDVGASYFLARLPKKMGIYLGLTGVTIPYNDCFALGLVDVIVDSASFPAIIKNLQAASLEKHADATVAEVIREFTITPPDSDLFKHQCEIETCFAKNSVEEIVDTLSRYPGVWCEEVTNTLALKSPTSLKVTLRLLQTSAKLSFDECMELETLLMQHFIHVPDYYEGVRAAIIDKDRKPHWQPANLADVSSARVAEFFAPLVVRQ